MDLMMAHNSAYLAHIWRIKAHNNQKRMSMHRLSWDEYFIKIAEVAALRGTCPRALVGCVLVRDNRVIALGYNGAPPGQNHCTDAGCLMVDNHCTRATHAEQNAIVQCALHGTSSRGATCYTTHFPCVTCAKMLIGAGVERVVYLHDYANGRGDEFFKWAKIEIEQLKVGN